MSASYTYALTDFVASSGKVNPGKLVEEVSAALAITPTTVDVDADVVITFTDALSSGDETDLNAVVAAHTGIRTNLIFHAASKLINESLEITSESDWQDLGGAVTNIGFFIKDLANARGRVVSACKTVGSGAQLRIVEDNGVDTPTVLRAAFDIGDTGGNWLLKKFFTDTNPSSGDAQFILQGRLNGATSASIRFVTLTLLEVVVVS